MSFPTSGPTNGPTGAPTTGSTTGPAAGSSAAAGSPAPGFYPDATDPRTERWFDGMGWTDYTRPAASSGFGAPGGAPAAGGGTAFGGPAAGWQAGAPPLAPPANPAALPALILAILFPLVGFILAIVALKKAKQLQAQGQAPVGRGQAQWALGISIALGVVGLLGALAVIALPVFVNQQDRAAAESGYAVLEQEIVTAFAEEADVAVTVDCPAAMPARDGSESTCVATADDGSTLDVKIAWSSVDGYWDWWVE